jgi:hypothetical protein
MIKFIKKIKDGKEIIVMVNMVQEKGEQAVHKPERNHD